MSELYICIECEVASQIDEPTPLNKHGLCPRCGSSSVVSVDTLTDVFSKHKRAQQALPSVDKDHAKRVQAMREQRKRDSRPLVEYLKSLIKPDTTSNISIENAAILARALEEWDGWAWHVSYPWACGYQGIDDNPCPGHFTIELVQGVKNGERWLITIDAALAEVSLFQDGMN